MALNQIHDAFSLVDQPWLPVIDLAGKRREVSLRELFASCEEMRALAGDLPTQTFALLRLLLAILYPALDGPLTDEDWTRLWRDGPLPVDDIGGYLGDIGDRFDLFHPEKPFYQVSDLRTANPDAERWGLGKLIADVPNGIPYLTSRSGAALARISAAEAARWLVHCQAFDPSGIKSGAAGDDRVKGGRGYPIGVGHAGNLGGLFAEGRTLRETLLLNLMPLGLNYLRQSLDDKPVWERDPLNSGEEDAERRGPHGVLTLYTWQSRRIRLFHTDGLVTGAMIANGDRLPPHNLHDLEPMSAWRRSPNQEKALKLPLVYLPRTHDHRRALWRGLGAILPPSRSTHGSDAAAVHPPVLTQWLARLHTRSLVEADYRVTTRAIGVSYGSNQSVVDEIYDDSLTMPLRVLDGDGQLRTTVVDSSADAEQATQALRNLARDLTQAAGGDRPNADAAADRAAEAVYVEFDQRFRAWLSHLTADTDPLAAREVWQRVAMRIAVNHGDRLVNDAGPAAWVGRVIDNRRVASAFAELRFRKTLRRALPLSGAASPSDEPDRTTVEANQ